jgi:hypothetical protein
MKTFSRCRKPEFRLASFLLWKDFHTILSKHETKNHKYVQRDSHYPINLRSHSIIDNLFFQVRHAGKIYPTADLKNAEAPESDGFAVSKDWNNKTEAGDGQSNREKH